MTLFHQDDTETGVNYTRRTRIKWQALVNSVRNFASDYANSNYMHMYDSVRDV